MVNLWKGESLPSIFILASLFLIILSNALCFVERIPWRCPFKCPLIVLSESRKYLLIRVTFNFGHVEYFPLQTALMKVAFVGNHADAWYQRNVLRALGRSKIMLIVLSGAAWPSGVGRDAAGLRSSFHIPVCSQCSDSSTGVLVVVIFVV